MATFQAQIVDLVGEAFEDTAAMTQFLRDGVRQLVGVLPPKKIAEILTVHTLNTTLGATFSLNDADNTARGSIVEVSREDAESIKQLCRQIPVSLSSRAADPDDLFFATETDPVFYISGGTLTVLPTPTDSKTAEVIYVPLTNVAYGDEFINGFPNDLEPIVVLYAAIKSAQSLLALEEDEDLYVPIINTLKADYVQAINLMGAKMEQPKEESKDNTKAMQKLFTQMLEYGK